MRVRPGEIGAVMPSEIDRLAERDGGVAVAEGGAREGVAVMPVDEAQPCDVDPPVERLVEEAGLARSQGAKAHPSSASRAKVASQCSPI